MKNSSRHNVGSYFLGGELDILSYKLAIELLNDYECSLKTREFSSNHLMHKKSALITMIHYLKKRLCDDHRYYAIDKIKEIQQEFALIKNKTQVDTHIYLSEAIDKIYYDIFISNDYR